MIFVEQWTHVASVVIFFNLNLNDERLELEFRLHEMQMCFSIISVKFQISTNGMAKCAFKLNYKFDKDEQER